MEKIVSTTVDGCMYVNNPSALIELDQNNCTMPNCSRVIFNLGKKTYPQRDPETNKILKDENGNILYGPEVDVLATVLYFVDGTKISVVNSVHDGIELVDHTLSDGTIIKIATDESKERGVIYALLKRILSRPDKDGKMVDSGISRILNDLVKNSYDSTLEEAEVKIARAKSKAEYEANKHTAVPKKRYSIHETLERINKLLDKAECGDNVASLIASMTNELKQAEK